MANVGTEAVAELLCADGRCHARKAGAALPKEAGLRFARLGEKICGRACDDPESMLCRDCRTAEEKYMTGTLGKWHGMMGGPIAEGSHIVGGPKNIAEREALVAKQAAEEAKKAAATTRRAAPKSKAAKTAKAAANTAMNAASVAASVSENISRTGADIIRNALKRVNTLQKKAVAKTRKASSAAKAAAAMAVRASLSAERSSRSRRASVGSNLVYSPGRVAVSRVVSPNMNKQSVNMNTLRRMVANLALTPNGNMPPMEG